MFGSPFSFASRQIPAKRETSRMTSALCSWTRAPSGRATRWSGWRGIPYGCSAPQVAASRRSCGPLRTTGQEPLHRFSISTPRRLSGRRGSACRPPTVGPPAVSELHIECRTADSSCIGVGGGCAGRRGGVGAQRHAVSSRRRWPSGPNRHAHAQPVDLQRCGTARAVCVAHLPDVAGRLVGRCKHRDRRRH